MNKIFKVIWSKSKQCYIVVSEIAKNKTGKKKIVVASILAALAMQSGLITEVMAADPPSARLADASQATGTNGLAIGSAAKSMSNQSVAIGYFSVASAPASSPENPATAVGAGANAIGAGTSAYGLSAYATADYATAIGKSANAKATNTIAIGKESYSETTGSLALGLGAKNTGTSDFGATAIGPRANTAKGGSIAVGIDATATGLQSIAIGSGSATPNASQKTQYPQATSKYSIAIGTNSNSQADYSIALGFQTLANAQGASALGPASTASGKQSTAVGYKATSTKDNDNAFGSNVTANGGRATAIGDNSQAGNERATAIGADATASGLDSFAGASGTASGAASVAIGKVSKATDSSATAVGDGTSATGQGATALGSNATAKTGFDLAVGRAVTSDGGAATVVGYNSNVKGNQSTGMGSGINITSQKATGIGYQVNVSGDNAIGIGSSGDSTFVTASGASSIAMGTSAVANQEKAIAIGANSKGTNIGATALGRSSEATGASATALGSLASATGSTATAVGMEASATGNESLAIGKKASATSGRALAVGTNTTATGASSVAVGSGAGGSGIIGFAGSLNSTAGVVNTNRTINYATTADGDNAVALGFYANAKNSGVAVGQKALAATGGVAIGKGVLEDTGNNHAGGVVIGQDSASTGVYSLAMGFNAFASGSTSMAIGHTVSADGGFAVAMGRKVSATGTSTAIGHHATATNGGLAIGSQGNDSSNDRTTASATGAVAIGKNAKATSEDAVAIGTNAQATLQGAVALGSGSTTATGATSQGSTTINGITYNFAGATGNPNMQVSVGSAGATRQIKNVAAGEVSATSTDAINGSQLYAVASAVKPLKYVSVNSAAAGTGSNVDNDGAQGGNSIAIGPSSTVTRQNGIAIGSGAQSLSEDSVVIGRDAKAETKTGAGLTTTSRAIVIGSNSRVAADVTQGVAIGSGLSPDEGAVVTGDQSIAIGGNVKVDGHSAIAIGGDDARKAANQLVSYTNTDDTEVTGTLQTAIQNLTGYNLSNYKGTTASHAGVAYGTSALAGNAGVAIGTAADSMTRMNDKGQVVNNKPVTNAVAIGTGARANFDNSVAIGGGSNTDHYATKQVNAVIDGVEVKWSGGENISPGDVVSFGAKGFERQLKNVAPGEVSQTSTDAVNGSQIYSLARKVTNIMNGGSGSVVNVNATGEPLSKVVTGTGVSKVEKYYRTVDVKDDGTLVTGAVAQTPTSLALVNVDQTDTNKQTQTPRILGNVANGVKDNDAVNVSQLNAAKVKYFAVNSSDAGNINNDGATGTDAIAIGPSAVSNAVGSVALGKDAKANGDFTVALGGGNWQFKGAQANGVGTTALGSNTKTQENINYQTAIGFGATTSAESALALGYNAAASAQNAIALGRSASTAGQDAVALGSSSQAKGDSGLAIGNGAQANSNSVISLGYQANNGASNNTYGVAIGWASGMQSNGLNNVGVGTNAGRQVIGNNNTSLGNGAGNIANTKIYTSESIMLGTGAKVVGSSATKSIDNVIAIGKNTSGSASSAIAVGINAGSSAENGVAIGPNSNTSAYNGIALGSFSEASTTAGVLGYNVNTNRTDKYAGLTDIALTSKLGAVSVGNSTMTRQITGVAAGTNDTDAVNIAQLKSVNLAFTGNTGSGDVNLANSKLSINGDNTYIKTAANGKQLTISPNVQNITLNNGRASASTGLADASNVAQAINNVVSGVQLDIIANKGTKTGSVNLSNQKLTVTGGNGIRTDIYSNTSGQNLVIGLEPELVNATTKGIGLTGDTGSTGLKYLKDGDATFKVAGDGNLVTTAGSAAGVKVSVDSTKVKDLAVEAVTVSKANTVDNPITVTSTTSTNSKDYAIGIDTTKLAAKTNLAYTANGAAAKTVSLAKGLNFINGTNTVSSVDSDGKVSFDLNKATQTSITNSATAVGRTITLNADSGTGSSQSLSNGNVSFAVSGATGDYISTTMDGSAVKVSTKRATINSDANTGAASVTGADGLATAKNVASAINNTNTVLGNKITKNAQDIATNTSNITANKNQITTNTTNIATNTTNIAHTIALADDAGASTTAKSLKDGNVSFNIKGDNKYISTAASGNDVTLTVNEQAIKDAAKSASSFKVKANTHAEEEVKGGDTIAFNNGDNIEISQNGKTFTIGTAKNITVDSVTAGNTVINTSGLTNGTTAITGTGITTDKVTVGGISIDKTAGINAGGKVISNVASGTVNNNATDDSNAANIGDVKQAVANLSQNLNITDGTNNGTVDLKKQKLNVAGANGVTATVNNQTITVGLDADTVNATTKGIGLTADTGSTGNKYLKDGDVSFAVTGDGNLVSTSATAAGVKVAVDAAKVKDLAVSAVTVSKDAQADNPITVTPTAGANSKDYAIGIDTTKLAAKTDLTYRANSAADANAKKVSLSKGLDFVDGDSTVATVDNDGKVSFDLNTATKNQINTNTTDITANKGKIATNTTNIAANTTALARNISLGADTGTASSQSLSTADVAFNVKGATGDFVSTNMNGNTVEISTKRATINSNATTGEASVTGNDGLATAQNVADAINKAADAAKAGAAWNITTNSSTTDKTAVKGGDTVDLVNGDNIEITQDGTDKKKITVATKKDITVDSVTANNKVTVGSGANKITLDGTDGSVTGKAFTGTTFTGTSFTGTSFTAGNTVINTNGLTNGTTAITGTGVTTDNVTVGGISIDKTAGINAGNKVISNVASGGTTATNAANIGDVQNAVANLSQNLNITDGTHDGTVDLKNQKLNVAGANGVTATVNNQTITVGLDANTVNATTKGIGLTADTGSTGNKYLKDGDVSFAVTGDGSLVSTSATAAGVKVAVNSASITAGADGTITGPTKDGVATAQNVADAINAAKKASKTEITANTGEAANATTGNVTLTSTTAADGHTIYDVKLNDKVTLGSGANTVTIDGTSGAITGKTATIGGVTVNGMANTIGGLSNTTWNGTAVSGRAATEDQLKAATGATTLKFTGDVATNTGSVNLKDDTFGIKGDGKYISTDVNGKNVNLTVSEAEVKKSAVAAVTVSTDTTDANNPLTVTPTTSADGTTKDYKVTIDGTKIANKTNLSYKANGGTAKQVSLADGLNFKNGTLTTASIDDNGVVKYDVNTAAITAGADGTITGPTTDGVATAQNVADAINAAKKASKTEITANTGEAANATTGNVTLTSTTAADGHTIYDVKLNDKVTLGTGANAVTVDGTAAKVTAGVTTVDGATGTITTGGTNSIKVDGATGTVTGLTNKDWTPGVTKAVTGRAATEDQLQKVADAASSQTWNITADKAGTTGAQTGTKKNATVGKDETVELVAGDNLTINQNERKFTYSLNKDLASLTSVSIGTGTTETIKLDGATGKITAKNAVIGGVTVDGDNNHVTGLANTTWNGTATTGRAATEDQLKAVAETAKTTTDAVNLKFTGDTNTSPGVVNLKDDTFGIVGDGKYVSTDANGKNLTVKVSEAEVKKSAVAAVTVSTDTTDANNPLTVTPTTSADGTTKDYKVTIDGTKIANKTNLSYKANDGTAKQVSLADGLNFKNGTLTTASIDDAGVVKYDVNTAAITAGADGTITGPTTDGVATAQNVADAINAAKKASKTEITANTGEAANATTGNVTLTSTTAADGHTIYDVKLNDKVTLGSGANAVTIDGTAGKATIGSSVINGVNNTFTTGGAKAVTLDGATGTITGTTANIGGVTVNGTANTIGGLSNTTWNGTATTGRAATEDQLKAVADAAGSQTWEITADKDAATSGAQTGTKKNAKVGKDDKVQLIAGENLTVNQNERDFTYSLNKDLVKMNSATFEATGGKTTVIKGDSIVQTDGANVNTSNATSNTITDGTNTSTITAGKAQIGTVGIDGVVSKISTGGTNAVVVNGADGTIKTGNVTVTGGTTNDITGLSNTTVTAADFATKGRAATEEQLKAATGATTLKFTGDVATNTGSVNLKDDTFGIKGDGKYISTDVNGKNVNLTISEAEVKKSAVAAVTVSTDTRDANNPLTVTPTTSADGTTKDYKVTIDGTKIANKTNLSYKANDGTAKQVSLADGLNFKNGTLTTASIDDNGVVKYDVNTASITAGADGTITGPTTDGVATAQNVADAINAAKKAAKTEITANAGEATNSTKGNVTLTSTTAADGHTIYDVKLNDKVTLGSGANAVTIDGTAGKATIGSSIVDGVNSTFTTGGANAVKLDGAAGTIKTGTVTVTGGTTNDITGLSNTTVTSADFATKGRAATEEQLKAVGEQTWQITADKDATTSGAQTGTKKNAKVGKDDKVQLIAGENLTVNQNERDFTYSLNKDLVKMNSATFEATGGRTTVIKGDSIVQTDGTKVNTSTAGGSSVADGTKSTETTADGQVIKDGAKSNKSTVDSNVIDDGNGNVNTSNATSNTITDGTNTSTVTAGKAQIGTVGIDGVASKITTGGANAVVINGADGTVKTGTVTVIGGTTNDITGLSNTTVTAADFATKGRAATEEQLKAVGEQTWQITADKDATTSGVQTGTKKDAKVGKDDKVQLIAGENLTVNQNERDFTYSLNKDLVKMNSATFEATGGKTTVIKGDSIVQTDGTKVNRSTAAGNTVVDGAKSTATTADGTTVTTANGNTNYAADGVRINTTGKTPVSLTDAGLDNGNNVIKNVASGHVNNDATDNTNAANIADVKKATTTVTANAGEAANATTGNVTLTSTTAADGHTIYDVKLNDKVTLGSGANAVTIDGTAGKATFGSSVVDGVNNTFTTGGANAVKLDGAAGTIKTGTVTVTGGTTNDITGLSNTTVTAADFATKGRAATEEQLKAVGEQTWQITADKDATTSGAQTGTKKDAKVGKNDKVQLIAGENMTVNQNERDFTFTLNKDLVKMNSATFEATGGKTTVIKGDSIVQTDGTKVNTSTAGGNTVADGTKSTETTADGQVIKDGTKTNTSTVDENTLVDGAKSNKATVDSNVVDDGTGNVNTSNATSNTITDGTNRSTITAGKATIGSSVIDGVNNTFTTGGANAVKLDGAAGTIKTGTVTVTGGTTNDITGLSNTTITAADFATKGRAATEEQLKAVGEQTWQITADKDVTTSGAQTGTKKDAKVGKDDKVQLIAGENMTVNQNERDFTFTLNKDLVKMNSATFEATGGKITVIKGDSIVQTDGTKTNTATASGNTVANGTKSTETTADGQVIKDGAKSNKSTVSSNVIDDGTGNVNTSNATSNTITDGTNTSTITAGKATIGSSIIDGVNNTFTTGGASPVTLNGATGTITGKTANIGGVTVDGTNNHVMGLANKDWTPGVTQAVSGRAATEDQLQKVSDAVGAGWKVNTGKVTGSTGESNGATSTKVASGEEVQFQAGNNLIVDQNGKTVAYSLNKALKDLESATFNGTGTNKTVITGDSITQTAGTQTNTSTAGGNTVADGIKSTETTAAGQVIKNGAKSNKSTVDNNVIDDGTGNVNTSNATSNTITDGTNTTATTSSSVTVKDNAGNSTVITKDNITTGVGGNKITLDGTAGKATIGASVVDGVNNTFTTGGTNAVTMNGAAGTIKTGTVTVTGGTTNDITGLSNTTVTAADFATKGRAATEEQLKAVGEQTWQITADKDAITSGVQTGTKKDAKVGKDDKVQLIAGENMTVNQNERDFTFTLNKDLVKMNSATFLGTGSNTTVITGNSITQTAGTQTNTSTAGGNTVADGTKSTETTAAGQVIKDGTKSNKSTVDNNVIDDGNGNVNTSNATSNTITDGTNTTATTSSSVTVKDNAGNSTVITKDNVTTGVGANKITLDGTAGKATIGSSVVDGVNNTFTTGGTNAVTLDGGAGTIKTGTVTVTGGTTNDITGLSNTTVNSADFATKGRAATEEQLKAVGEQTWQITADKDTATSGAQTGTKKDAKVGKDNKVQLIAGENMTINQNERDFTFTLNKDLVKMNSATFLGTGSNTTVITGNSITQTAGTQTNTSTAAGNTVADGTKSTETTADGQVIKDGAKSNKSTVDSNVIDDGNGNVNTSNATSNTITDGTNTSTITAGKANIGNIAVDGVNNKITMGTGANPVTLDGANGHLDGLTNTTWVPGVTKATTGRAATEDQLQQVSDAVGAGWKVNTGTVAGSSGVSNGAASTKVSSGEEVKLQAGDNLVIDQNGKTVSYSLNKDLTKMNSATFEATGGKTTVIKGDSIVQTDGGKTNTSNAAGNTVVDGNKSTATTAAGTTIIDGAKTNTSTADKNVIDDGAGNTNVSNATSNTLKNAAGDETKADAKGVTVKDAAGNNATFTKDGITITKTGKDTVSLTSDGLDNGKNKIVNVAAGVANTDAVNVGQLKEYAAKSTTELTANNGETAGSTKGNIVLTKTTAADGHTIYDNKLNDKITLGTDPTKAITVDGTTGTVTGLTNKTWTPGSIVSGRAATEDQLKEAVADSGWKAAVDKEGSGQSTVVGTSPEKIKAEETVTFKAGNNMMVTQTGKSISYAVNPELTNMTSATFKDAAGNTTVTNGNGITITPGSANPTNPHAGPVSLTKDGLNNGNNQIKGVAPGTDPTDAVNVSQLNASNANTSQAINQIAGEVQHVGAHAAAMAALKPIQYDPLEPTQVMAGVGNYRGETAAALGLAHYTNENTMFNVGVSVGGNHNMVNAGVTHKFGYSPEKKNIPDRYKAGPISSVYVMQDEVSSLKKENAEQKYVIADQAARLTTLEAENEQQRRELAETKKGLDDLKAAVDKLLASKG
ncbi:YadA-like family protein [Veillonella sp.]|nr:YadA-like family protein [Veillonella sp.]MDU2334612.1 ESPR-type extended signal peptide-containing protein [Veillonella sp.]MDU2347837.1 ESPR-type extended signal peptide-containing protein [Veillonella sp.]